MPDKKSQSKVKAKAQTKSKGVVGLFKKIVKREPAAAKPAKANRAKTTAPKAPKAAKKKEAPPAPPPSEKKKPPSITITRPEVTRPPLVQMPTPKHEAPIGAPAILLPKGGQPVGTLTPVFRWMYVGGATHYEVEWSHDSHFGRGHSSALQSQQTLVTLDSSHALKPGIMYLWRVRAGNDSGWGPWSGTESFKAPEK
jgi:hypothetical protein